MAAFRVFSQMVKGRAWWVCPHWPPFHLPRGGLHSGRPVHTEGARVTVWPSFASTLGILYLLHSARRGPGPAAAGVRRGAPGLGAAPQVPAEPRGEDAGTLASARPEPRVRRRPHTRVEKTRVRSVPSFSFVQTCGSSVLGSARSRPSPRIFVLRPAPPAPAEPLPRPRRSERAASTAASSRTRLGRGREPGAEASPGVAPLGPRAPCWPHGAVAPRRKWGLSPERPSFHPCTPSWLPLRSRATSRRRRRTSSLLLYFVPVLLIGRLRAVLPPLYR